MKKLLRYAAGSLVPALIAAAAPEKTGQVAWLQGCWQLDSGGRVAEEQWMAPRGGIMLGVGRTVRDGKLVEYESVVLREEDGKLAYEAHPSGQPSAVFLSKTLDESSIVFENPTHDYPQRVGYKYDGAALLAWIDGTVNGKPRRVEFPYRRVACGGSSK